MTTPRQRLAEPPDYTIPIARELRDTFRALDALGPGWIFVVSGSTATPPTLPAQGAAYIVPAGATGAWAGHERHVAIFTPEGWLFRPPQPGFLAVVWDENLPYGRIYQYGDTSWRVWLFPATSVAFDTAGTDFVSTTLAGVMLEISLRLIAAEATLDDHETRITALEGADPGTGGGGNVTPDTHPVSANAADDEFETGSSIDTAGTRFTGATAWAWRNQGGATATIGQGSLILTAPVDAGGSMIRIVEQTISGAGVWHTKCAGAIRADFNAIGLLLLVNASAKSIAINRVSASGTQYNVVKYTNPTTFSTNSYTANDTARYATFHDWVYFEVEYDGTTCFYRVSPSGVLGTFVTLFSESAAGGFLGAAPDRVGLFAQAANTTVPCVAAFDWFRRIA